MPVGMPGSSGIYEPNGFTVVTQNIGDAHEFFISRHEILRYDVFFQSTEVATERNLLIRRDALVAKHHDFPCMQRIAHFGQDSIRYTL